MENSLSKIEQIHDDVFEFLLEKHFEEKKKGSDFFFKTRQRFSKGKESLWFLGNDDYAAISFWTGTDYQNKTPNIFLNIFTDMGIVLYVVFKDSSKKENVLNLLTNIIYDLNPNGKGVLRKVYAPNHNGSYLQYVKEFIEGDKKIIDDFLSTQGIWDEVDKHIQGNTTTTAISTDRDDDIEYSETFPRKLTEDEFYRMIGPILVKKNRTPDYFFDKNNYAPTSLSYAIKGFEVRNYRGIEYLKIDGIPVDTKWIVLTGENGFGKSSVLQGIAIGLFGNADGGYQLLDNKGFVMMEGKISDLWFMNLSVNFNANAITANAFTPVKNIAVYGASRLNIGGDSSRPDASSRMYNLFFPNGSLANIETALKESFAYNPEKFKLLKNAFCKLIPDLKDIVVETINKNPIVKYIENESKEYVTFENLASGFRNIIAVVGDIITRLSNENDDLEFLSHLRGVVIIDEFELHLHPKYQKSLPKILSEIFPQVLFVVSTHSPIPLLGMPKETVLLKVNRSTEKGVTIERLDVDFTNLLPNAILTSPIFGFQEIIPDAHSNSEIINVADSYDEVKNSEKIERKISSFLSPERTQEFLKLVKK